MRTRRACRFHPEKPAVARALCDACYQKFRSGSLKLEEAPDGPRNQIAASANPDRRYPKVVVPATVKKSGLPFPKEFDGIMPSGTATATMQKKIMDMVDRFMYNPGRVAAVMQRFFEQALSNNRVMVEYIDRLLPKKGGGPQVNINIVSPMLGQAPKKYDVEGNAIEVKPSG